MNSNDVLVLTEASVRVGHGHVMRCLSLAEEMRRRGLNVVFHSRDDYTTRLLTRCDKQVCKDASEVDAGYIIRDFKGGSAKDEVADEVGSGKKVLLMDEEGPARVHATLVVQAFATKRVQSELAHGADCEYLYGLEYAPLSGQFSRYRDKACPGKSVSSRLLVTLGGSDPLMTTVKYVKALKGAGFIGPITVVTDGTEVMNGRVSEFVADWEDSEILHDVDNMAEIMSRCDLVATKMGVTTLEAFCVGVGCVHIEPSSLHLQLQNEMHCQYENWAVIELGLGSELDFEESAETTIELLSNKKRLRALGSCAGELVDGKGAERIVDRLLS